MTRTWSHGLMILAAAGLLLLTAAGQGMALDWGYREWNRKDRHQLTREVSKGGYGIVRTDELKKWLDEGNNHCLSTPCPTPTVM